MSYVERFSRQTIKVDGQEVEVVIMGEGSDLSIGHDISTEMDQVASQLAYWGSVHAAAEAEKIKVESWYRRFRAEIADSMLAADPKVAEWKVKASIEKHDAFIKHKEAIAMAENNVVLCGAMFRAFERKSNQLQSRGAAMRSEIGAQGQATRTQPKEVAPQEGEPGWDLSSKGSEHDDEGLPEPKPTRSAEEVDARMKSIFAKKKPKKGSKKK